MKKNNYCLMLSEEVVAAIDARASREGTNRSALINRILAEYVSYVTPEMRVREILTSARDALHLAFRREAESDTALALCSSLAYRYNPTVRYTLDFDRSANTLGVLRVSLRTKNQVLIAMLYRFFELFARLEGEYVGNCEYTVGEGRFSRVLRLRDEGKTMLTLEGIGSLVADYLTMLDNAMKAYFRYAPREHEAFLAMGAIYRSYLAGAAALV